MTTAGDIVTIHPPPYTENERDLKQVPLEKAGRTGYVFVDYASGMDMSGTRKTDKPRTVWFTHDMNRRG